MRRIGLAVVLALSLFLAPLAAEAQQPGKVPQIWLPRPVASGGSALGRTGRLPQWPERVRLRRRPKHHYSVPIGELESRAAARSSGGAG